MWGWLPGRLILSGPLMGLGRLGGLPLRKGWAADRRALVCGVVGCLVLGVGNTPAVVGCCGLVVVVVCSWWVPPRALVRVGVACCRGSGAVRPGCLTRLGS